MFLSTIVYRLSQISITYIMYVLHSGSIKKTSLRSVSSRLQTRRHGRVLVGLAPPNKAPTTELKYETL